MSIISRTPVSPPRIEALSPGEQRPTFSVMIPVYNAGELLREAIQSVIANDDGEMQIEVVDDCSSDIDVEKLVRELAGERVGYFKQEQNVGSLRNFETCINRSKGKYIHLLHADDRVKKGFYQHAASVFDQFPQAAVLMTTWDYIDANGIFARKVNPRVSQIMLLEDCLDQLTSTLFTQYVSTIVRRDVYEQLGSFYGTHYGEDWIMWARAAKEYPVAYSPHSFCEYREHADSISGRGFTDGSNIQAMRFVAKTVSGLLDKEQTAANNRILRNYAGWLFGNGYSFGRGHENERMLYTALRALLKGSYNLRWYLRITKMRMRIFFKNRGTYE